MTAKICGGCGATVYKTPRHPAESFSTEILLWGLTLIAGGIAGFFGFVLTAGYAVWYGRSRLKRGTPFCMLCNSTLIFEVEAPEGQRILLERYGSQNVQIALDATVARIKELPCE